MILYVSPQLYRLCITLHHKSSMLLIIFHLSFMIQALFITSSRFKRKPPWFFDGCRIPSYCIYSSFICHISPYKVEGSWNTRKGELNRVSNMRNFRYPKNNSKNDTNDKVFLSWFIVSIPQNSFTFQLHCIFSSSFPTASTWPLHLVMSFH